MRGRHQDRLAFGQGGIDIRAGRQQRFQHARAPIGRRQRHGRDSIPIGGFDVGVGRR